MTVFGAFLPPTYMSAWYINKLIIDSHSSYQPAFRYFIMLFLCNIFISTNIVDTYLTYKYSNKRLRDELMCVICTDEMVSKAFLPFSAVRIAPRPRSTGEYITDLVQAFLVHSTN